MFRRKSKKSPLLSNAESVLYERRDIKGNALAGEGSPAKSV